MRTLFLLIVFFPLTSLVTAQPTSAWTLEKEIKGDWTSFELDNLFNLYLISQSGQLKKLNANGDSVAVYNDQRRFGVLGSTDVSNPLLLLLHYADYNTVVWLDRFLKPVNTVDLRAAGIITAKAVAAAFDGKVWVYDEWEQKLKKIGAKGELIQQTPDLRQILGEDIHPIAIKEGQQHVYCYDSIRGIYVFDYYGNFDKKMAVNGWAHWNVSGSGFSGQKDGALLSYDLASGSVSSVVLPDLGLRAKVLLGSNGKLYCLRKTNAGQPGALLIFKTSFSKESN